MRTRARPAFALRAADHNEGVFFHPPQSLVVLLHPIYLDAVDLGYDVTDKYGVSSRCLGVCKPADDYPARRVSGHRSQGGRYRSDLEGKDLIALPFHTDAEGRGHVGNDEPYPADVGTQGSAQGGFLKKCRRRLARGSRTQGQHCQRK